MTFKTIHTSYGLGRIASAEATGTPINLTHMAVGDGNGNPTTPTPGQTGLVRELYRHAVNRVYQDPDDPLLFTAELVVPADVGGFTVRECGIFDQDGGLFAVSNIPDTYKPTDEEGAFSDMVVRLQFKVANADVITLQVDPNVAVATQTWIINNINPASLFPGGTTHQILRKASNADGDTEWSDPDTTNVVVDVIEEKQTLAASQTVVTLAVATTRGAAVYIEGIRIGHEAGVDGWLEDGTDPDTKIVLGQARPAGSVIRVVQNEPLGSVPFPLARDLNLSDVPDKAVARTNLDVFNKAETRQMAPAGQVAHFARGTAPTGWMKANGAAVSRTAYADLFAAIGTTFGTGDGFSTFNLPDLRGEFLRGLDDGRGVDAGRAIGSAQADDFKSHTHQAPTGTGASTGGTDPYEIPPGNVRFPNYDYVAAAPVSATGGTETRPRNVALLACIKF
ncbi:phage tail protein [Bradyrhizobium sp. BWC-3-1]|uniref:phage tail-collar fiber domain-containing protein n=1 Tax=Bradyrhizobium sp. BWC-3-1 TaxID=3080012 RepID=UPI00293E1D6F|nr:phage tail protein [Bradyrhizobium sp. BWC-3-1]WOH61901.1 phage tail protein [Bradyrhizobium sp. BWC-3-1]